MVQGVDSQALFHHCRGSEWYPVEDNYEIKGKLQFDSGSSDILLLQLFRKLLICNQSLPAVPGSMNGYL